MTVKNITEAWTMADKLFPTDYMHDSVSSSRAGYPIYRSTFNGCNAWISDLGNRLEINFDNGETVNIWIDEEVEEVEEVETNNSVEAAHAVVEFAKTVNPLFPVENKLHVVLTVDGSSWNNNLIERKIYDGLTRGETWLGSDLVAHWCNNNGIRWGIISDTKIVHYSHGNFGGHYVISAYVG